MSNNILIRIMQTVIVVLVGCVSPEYAQTLFIDKSKEDLLDKNLRKNMGDATEITAGRIDASKLEIHETLPLTWKARDNG